MRSTLRNNSLIGVLVAACALSWATYQHLPKSVSDSDRAALASGYAPPDKNFPQTDVTEKYNADAAKLLAPNLYARAIVVAEEAFKLIVDGRFQIDQSATKLKKALNLPDGQVISLPSGELDPNAPLFPAEIAVLTPRGIRESLEMRKHQLTTPDIPWAVYCEWERRDFVFTVNRILHPSDEEKVILDAMIRTATLANEPGDSVRATGINRTQFDDRPVITGGMLPLEAVGQR
jgi:hypothetical protein